MNGSRMPTVKIAFNNIIHRRFRSYCIVLLTAFTTFLILAGTLLGFSLQNGIESISARLGADAMIVPQSAVDSFESALLTGSPSTFYLTADLAGRIMCMEGIERASTQLFISTFDSEHCAALVQIIGYEPETDFVVAPWLKDSKLTAPGYGEAIIGGNIQFKTGDKLPLFSVKLNIAGVLDKTGMGFDNSVFVNMETARMLLAEYEKFSGALPLPAGSDAGGVVSAILLDIKNGVDPTTFQRGINTRFRNDGVRYVSSQTMLADTSKNLNLVIGVLAVLLAALWVLAIFALTVIFTITFNERQYEFGILRSIGATRQKLAAIVITESALLCAFGAICGASAVRLAVFPYGVLIERLLQAAYLPPGSTITAAIFAACLALGSAAGPLASLFSVMRIGKREAFSNLREGL